MPYRRFGSKLPYTYANEICLAVNPYQWLDIYGGELRRQYMHASSGDSVSLPPHVYSISASAFNGLKEADQSIIISGESGAGS